MEIKVCPVCSKEFPCYADEDGRTCWCESFPKIEINDALDCLCPDCLTNKALEQGYSQNEIDVENIIHFDKIVPAFIKYYRNCKKKILVELKDLPSKGSIQPKKRGRKYYYYLAYREGDKVKFKYIGKEQPVELEKKLKRSKLLKRKLIIINDYLYSLGMTRRINRLSLSQRFQVFERDNFTCQYCGRNVKDDKIILAVDHILPKKLGGSDKLDNLITSCRECNLGKHAKYFKSIINENN